MEAFRDRRKNVEIKARMPSGVSDGDPRLGTFTCHLVQRDTFFPCESGRLKLREENITSGGSPTTSRATLIWYSRADMPGPKESDVAMCPVASESVQAMREVLGRAHAGRTTELRKRRRLYMRGRTRVHVDEVEGLPGRFLELEVLLGVSEDPATGESEAREIMSDLGVATDHLLTGSYVEMLEQPLKV